MSADRTEKLTINRTHNATMVKITITEDGTTVNYTVKTYESQIPDAAATARKRADDILFKLRLNAQA